MRNMRILLVGSGGREAALYWAMLKSMLVELIFCVPGNAGMDPKMCRKIALDDLQGIVDLAVSERIDLVVVGPEAPLVAGLADALRERGIYVFGPDRFCAQLEGSKAFTKWLCTHLGMPTAQYSVARDFETAAAIIRGFDAEQVVKANGLCAGRGVFVCRSSAAALEHAERLMVWKSLGIAGAILVIEELLRGVERTFLFACDGERAVPFPVAEDYKRQGDGDVGPNTGGMGARSPAPGADDVLTEEIRRLFVDPVLRWCREQGHPYRGILYVGVMMTEEGPKLLEYNCRFGDPEAQVILPRLEDGLVELMLAASGYYPGGLSGRGPLKVSSDVTVGVVIAARGYPDDPQKGFQVFGIPSAEQYGQLFLGGIKRVGGSYVADGGRLLTVLGRGATFAEARAQAYVAAGCIVSATPETFCRYDIASVVS